MALDQLLTVGGSAIATIVAWLVASRRGAQIARVIHVALGVADALGVEPADAIAWAARRLGITLKPAEISKAAVRLGQLRLKAELDGLGAAADGLLKRHPDWDPANRKDGAP